MRRLFVFSFICLFIVCVPGVAGALTITFDEFGPATSDITQAQPLRDEYASQGVRFRGPSELDGGAVLDVSSNFGTPAYSGSNFLAFNSGATLANKGIPQAPEIISFDNLWQTVSIYVSGGITKDRFILEAFGPDAVTSVGKKEITTYEFALLSITSERGISRVKLSSGEESDGIFVADSLELTTLVSRVPEPGTMLLLGLGLIGIGVLRKRN